MFSALEALEERDKNQHPDDATYEANVERVRSARGRPRGRPSPVFVGPAEMNELRRRTREFRTTCVEDIPRGHF